MDGSLPGLRTIDQIIKTASEKLDPGALQWANAGAGQGVTVANNRQALSAHALVPSVGRDVSTVDLATSVVGVELEMPVFLAPIGALELYDAGDALTAATAASLASTSIFCAMLTRSVWSEVSDTAPGRHFFQMYACGDRGWIGRALADIQDAGFGGVCLTMDSAAIARRDLGIEEGYVWESAPHLSPNLGGYEWDPAYRARYTWDDLEWLCSQTSLPVIAKGIMNRSDARTAVDCGVSAIYVSNHGGRMVDNSISTIEALPDIVKAVPDTDVVVDGGFTRGAEVVIALALGAKAVGIGRLQCYGLGAGGQDGLVATLDILRQEIFDTLTNIGCRSLSELDATFLRV